MRMRGEKDKAEGVLQGAPAVRFYGWVNIALTENV